MDVEYNTPAVSFLPAGMDAIDELLRKKGIDPLMAGRVASGTPAVSLINPPTNPLPAEKCGNAPDQVPDLKDRGVQNAVTAGRTPPRTNAGKALEASGFFDQGKGGEGESSSKLPAVSLTKEYAPGTRAYDYAVGATAQPRVPAPRTVEATAPDIGQPGFNTPPVSLLGTPTQPPAPQPRNLEDEFRALQRQEPTREQFPAQKMSMARKLLGILASTAAGMGGGNVAGETARRFLSAPERNAEERFDQAHQTWEGKVGNLMRAAKLREEDVRNRNVQSEIDARKPDNPSDKKVDEGFNKQGQRVHVYQRPDGTEYTKVFPDIVKEQRQTHTSAFEAFAYGDANERKAAQDFLDLEKRLGSRYRNPTEFEEKYKLFKEDPQTYRAMFGDKNADKPDRATATRMLNYFDKRRREVSEDFTLDDQQKQEQLQEIEKLERPFMEAVQPNASRGNSDRVEVIHPDGRRGSIPKSQLEAAKKKGYREASPK